MIQDFILFKDIFSKAADWSQGSQFPNPVCFGPSALLMWPYSVIRSVAVVTNWMSLTTYNLKNQAWTCANPPSNFTFKLLLCVWDVWCGHTYHTCPCQRTTFGTQLLPPTLFWDRVSLVLSDPMYKLQAKCRKSFWVILSVSHPASGVLGLQMKANASGLFTWPPGTMLT